jgi:hypothetical protein
MILVLKLVLQKQRSWKPNEEEDRIAMAVNPMNDPFKKKQVQWGQKYS